MRFLVSTFGKGDAGAVLLAMRSLPFDRLVVIGGPGSEECEDLLALRRLESMVGHEVSFERVEDTDFMDMVEEISDLLSRLSKEGHGANEVCLSIGGGTKLVADAALFAAFRMGVPAYHVSDRVVRLPVIKGVTASGRFTRLESDFIRALREPTSLDEMERTLGPQSRQSVERVMRGLRRAGIVEAWLESGQVRVSLTIEGAEVARAVDRSDVRRQAGISRGLRRPRAPSAP